MTNKEAFHASTEEQIESALRKAWGDNGQCNSCGWFSAFYEVSNDLWPHKQGDVDEWWTWCHSKDRADEDSHRGCYIYPIFDPAANAESVNKDEC